ncbi:hypothetical protein BKA57DRAFT_464716 [Linnemannia elongata]|nr:hypothetical protein BKA57DRAFT_479911 [Linnemannia elongata]KAH7046972.1 hypothetical protein BKA57DRAFT_464716 [Linnemannia elongata]
MSIRPLPLLFLFLLQSARWTESDRLHREVLGRGGVMVPVSCSNAVSPHHSTLSFHSTHPTHPSVRSPPSSHMWYIHHRFTPSFWSSIDIYFILSS